MEALEQLQDQLRSFHDDVSSSGTAANEYLDNISLKVDGLHENFGALHHDLIQWKIELAPRLLRQVTHIKWLLFVLVALVLWRLFSS